MKIAKAETEAAKAGCFALRRAVFIEEQQIPEAEEWDAHDATCAHYLAEDETGPAGTARLIADGDVAKIGRVAVDQRTRGTGLGRDLMQFILDDIDAARFKTAFVEAQVSAIPFYEKLGFTAYGPDYDDGSGILHRKMTRPMTPRHSD